MKRLLYLLLIPFTLFSQNVTRDWDDTDLIVKNVTVTGTISGFAELEFDSVTQMKAFDFSQTADGARIKCNGYNVANDEKFGPDVFWDSTSTAVDDGLTVFDPTIAGNGRLTRDLSGIVDINWAGAVGDYDENATQDDNTDDTYTDNSAAIQTVIDYLMLLDGGTMIIPSGKFGLDSVLNIKYRHHKDSDSGGFRRFGGIKISGIHATNNDSIFESLPGCALVASKTNTTGILNLVSVTDIVVEDLSLINKADSAPFMLNTTSYSKGEPSGAYVTDAAITASDNTLTSATGSWVSGDAGEVIRVAGAGAAGADLITTIDSYTSATEVELTDAAGTTVSGAVSYWPEPVPSSTTHVTFTDIVFQDDETVTGAVVDLQNTKFLRFEKCTWLTGTRALNIGEDVATEPYPLMNGDVSNLVFMECIFAGDTYYKQGRVVSWLNSEWWPIKGGSGQAARVIAEGNEIFRGISLINCKAIFDGDGTGTFFDWGDQASSLSVVAGAFGDYNRAFVLDSSVRGVASFMGTIFDNSASGNRDIEVTSNYAGRVFVNGDHSVTQSAGRQAITDGRADLDEVLRYQVAAHEEIQSNYTLTGGASYQSVITTARRLRGGLYRVTLACNIASLHSSIYRMRLKNFNETHVERYIASGENSTLSWTGLLRLSAPTPTTTSVAGTVSSSGTALTGVGTNFNPELTVGDWIEVIATGELAQIASVTNDTNAVLEEAFYYGDISSQSVQSVASPSVLEMEVRQINAGSTSTVTAKGANSGNSFILIEEL